MQLAIDFSTPRARGEAAANAALAKADVGYCARKKGNGTSGGRMWSAVR